MTTKARAATKRRRPPKPTPFEALPLLLTVQQAYEYLGIRRTKFYELRAAGLIPAVEFGPQSVRFHKDDLRAYAERRRTERTR